MICQHKALAEGKWFDLTFAQQMANIGSEVFRAIMSRDKKDEKSADLSFERALELIDLTLEDPKNRPRLREISRVRESFVDYFKYDNQYRQTEESINQYFYNFNYLARIGV
ncbi:MAG: hypothetical protein WC451_05095 [Patescibacteria group bacterium]